MIRYLKKLSNLGRYSSPFNPMSQKKVWLSALPIALFLTSCDSIIATGGRFSSPFPELSQIAAFSIIWLLPALVLWGNTRSNHPETRYGGHTGDGQPVYLETGRIIPGDPSLANFVANLWLVVYPAGYFYYIHTHLYTLIFPLTGFPNIDWILFRIIFPSSFLAAIWMLIDVIRKSPFFFIKWIIFCWKVLILLASINLLGWLLALFIPLFLELIMGLVSWLFRR
jgi:hypothetical protein